MSVAGGDRQPPAVAGQAHGRQRLLAGHFFQHPLVVDSKPGQRPVAPQQQQFGAGRRKLHGGDRGRHLPQPDDLAGKIKQRQVAGVGGRRDVPFGCGHAGDAVGHTLAPLCPAGPVQVAQQTFPRPGQQVVAGRRSRQGGDGTVEMDLPAQLLFGECGELTVPSGQQSQSARAQHPVGPAAQLLRVNQPAVRVVDLHLAVRSGAEHPGRIAEHRHPDHGRCRLFPPDHLGRTRGLPGRGGRL